MGHLKARLFGLVIIAVFVGMTYYNWHLRDTEGSYYPKLALFGPVGIVGGLFMLLFPSKAGKPETTRDRLLVLLIFAVGFAAGGYNLYLMDPHFFGR